MTAMPRIAQLFLLLAALLLPTTADAEEKILRYYSDIAIQKDGDLLVTEIITVRAEGNQIRRGIYRDFPTRYRGRHGENIRVAFDLIGVTRDGQPDQARTEARSNGVRIYIGKADVFLEPGDYRYTINYRTSRQLGRFKEFDELYWNVTGNGWAFPIDEAEARITLPSPVKFGQRAAYTGIQGATGQQSEVTSERLGEIAFRTTMPLAPSEGMTVAVAWPKGVVDEPSDFTRLGWLLADWAAPLAGVAGLAAVLGYLFYAWRKAGRDPRPGTVVPLFSPPDNLSPAAMRYIVEQKLDNRAFAASLVDAAVKGHVRLVEEDGGWFGKNKRRIERFVYGEPQPLAPAEQGSLDALVSPNSSLLMDQKNHATFSAAKKSLSGSFAEAYDGKLFLRNLGWIGAAVVIFVGALWLAAALVVLAEGAETRPLVVLSAAGLAIAALVFHAAPNDKGTGRCLLHLVAAIVGGAAVVIAFPVIPDALRTGNLLPLAIPLIGLPFVISSFFWMSAPTKEGRAVLDRIAGFKQYLSITERERLDRMTAPEDTPEIFEKYLPYAIALGVENRWADRFQGVLAAAAAAPGGHQGFLWYSGSDNPWDNPTGFASSMGSSLASTISSASSAPGSSSGSGGGGFSGGGGGGGGGGGW
jgi:uncharacterized membrane protein YgcG